MPTSTDNQDYGEADKKNLPEQGNVEKSTGPAMGNLPLTPKNDENNFTSDDQKGKKVDADLENEDEQPADQ